MVNAIRNYKTLFLAQKKTRYLTEKVYIYIQNSTLIKPSERVKCHNWFDWALPKREIMNFKLLILITFVFFFHVLVHRASMFVTFATCFAGIPFIICMTDKVFLKVIFWRCLMVTYVACVAYTSWFSGLVDLKGPRPCKS